MDENQLNAKAAAEVANQAIARAWWNGIDLTFSGIDLADCITYDVLSVLGNAWLMDENRKAQAEQQAVTA